MNTVLAISEEAMAVKPIMAKGTTNNEAEWQAVLAQDRAWDGRLYYGVRSTGIYCRPSCPSRRPRRDQVEFFFDTVAAQAAGFRACKRCHPNQPGREDAQLAAVKRGCEYIRAKLDATLSLDELGAQAGLRPVPLPRGFKKATRLTPQPDIP